MKYVYKLVAAVGALAVIPALFLLKIIYFKISSAALSAIFYIGQLAGIEQITNALNGSNTVPDSIADIYSLYDLYSLFSDIGSSETSDLIEKLNPLITPAITTAVVLVLIVICAIITAIFAIATKNNRYVIYSSICGIGLSLMLYECFSDLASIILSGTVSLATVLDSVWAGMIGSFEKLELVTNFWFIPAIFGAIILWTVLYNYTLPEKEKRERKLMLGEADEE
jgi:hypothetical protein